MFRSPAFFHSTITQQSIIILQSIEYAKWAYLWNLIYTSRSQHYMKRGFTSHQNCSQLNCQKDSTSAPKQSNFSVGNPFEMLVLHLAFSYQGYCKKIRQRKLHRYLWRNSIKVLCLSSCPDSCCGMQVHFFISPPNKAMR